jgi:hypothetical protein
MALVTPFETGSQTDARVSSAAVAPLTPGRYRTQSVPWRDWHGTIVVTPIGVPARPQGHCTWRVAALRAQAILPAARASAAGAQSTVLAPARSPFQTVVAVLTLCVH